MAVDRHTFELNDEVNGGQTILASDVIAGAYTGAKGERVK